MTSKKYTDKLVHISTIKEEMKLIEGSKTCYITPSGQVYCDYGNDMFYPKKNYINKYNGYVYIGINFSDGIIRTRRLHILLAKAFIPNPDNLPIVLHRDNNKQNNDLTNLKWGTISENTKQAYDDGLAKNDKGFEDSQSIPICQFDLNGNLSNIFGSISIASQKTGISKHGIVYQCQHLVKTHPRRGFYYRYLDEYEKFGFVL